MPFQKGHKINVGHHWKLSEKTKRKISIGRKRRKKELGYLNSEETRQKIKESRKGMRLTESHKLHLKEVALGEKNHNWKGDDVGYSGVHKWIAKVLGKPTKCEHCGKDNLTGKKIHWANKSGKYLRDKDDWLRLCVKCHSEYDLNKLTLKI